MAMKLEEGLSRLREIEEYEFEKFISELWEKYNWQTKVTSGSNDRGVDIVAERDKPVRQKHLIQVKRWENDNKVGGPDIREYSSLHRRDRDVDAVVVVTTSSFSSQARTEAKDLNVKLINGSDLWEIITEVAAEGLVREYAGLECTYCETADFQDESALQNHLCEEHGHTDCPECSDIFHTDHKLQKHLCEEHSYTGCPECTDTFQNRSPLREHLREKHGYTGCSECNDIFHNDRIKQHLSEEHGYTDCAECSEIFQSDNKLQQHLTKEHNSCSECDDMFQDQRSLHEHLIREHGHTDCSECSDIFQNDRKLQQHLCRKHGYTSCPECSDVFHSDRIQEHLDKEHGRNYLS